MLLCCKRTASLKTKAQAVVVITAWVSWSSISCDCNTRSTFLKYFTGVLGFLEFDNKHFPQVIFLFCSSRKKRILTCSYVPPNKLFPTSEISSHIPLLQSSSIAGSSLNELISWGKKITSKINHEITETTQSFCMPGMVQLFSPLHNGSLTAF